MSEDEVGPGSVEDWQAELVIVREYDDREEAIYAAEELHDMGFHPQISPRPRASKHEDDDVMGAPPPARHKTELYVPRHEASEATAVVADFYVEPLPDPFTTDEVLEWADDLERRSKENDPRATAFFIFAILLVFAIIGVGAYLGL